MAEAGTERLSAPQAGRRAAFEEVRGPSFDFATLLGVLGGFALIGGAMVLGGSVDSFLDLPAILIVIGGTLFVTAISYGLTDILRCQSVLLRTLIYHSERPDAAARRALALAAEARRDGVLALQRHQRRLQDSPFLRHALSLAADGNTGDQIEAILHAEIGETAGRHLRAAAVLRRAGEVAPAMGLIGTLIGLVQMLGRLDDPAAIGPAMAVALLTTFYGAVLAHMVFLPLAHKLERNAEIERTVKRIYTAGAASIGRGENPRRLELLLNTMLAPSERLRTYD